MGLSYISLVIKSLSKIFVKRAKKVQKNALKRVATQNVSCLLFLPKCIAMNSLMLFELVIVVHII